MQHVSCAVLERLGSLELNFAASLERGKKISKRRRQGGRGGRVRAPCSAGAVDLESTWDACGNCVAAREPNGGSLARGQQDTCVW